MVGHRWDTDGKCMDCGLDGAEEDHEFRPIAPCPTPDLHYEGNDDPPSYGDRDYLGPVKWRP